MRGWVSDWGGEAESVTRAVKLKVPARMGTPESTPLLGSRVTPGGKAAPPSSMFQVKGGTPPGAFSVAE